MPFDTSEEAWNEKCYHPHCDIEWTHKTGRTLFWCDCIGEYCSCTRHTENGLLFWCKNHLPSYIKPYVTDKKECKDYISKMPISYFCDDCINHCKSDDCGCVPYEHMIIYLNNN